MQLNQNEFHPSSRSTFVVPILLRLALHRWRRRVLDLEPMVDLALAVVRPDALRHDALAAERTRMLEDGAVRRGAEIRQDHAHAVDRSPHRSACHEEEMAAGGVITRADISMTKTVTVRRQSNS